MIIIIAPSCTMNQGEGCNYFNSWCVGGLAVGSFEPSQLPHAVFIQLLVQGDTYGTGNTLDQGQ